MLKEIRKIVTVIFLQIFCVYFLFALGGIGMITLFLILCQIDESYSEYISIWIQYLFWIYLWYKYFCWKKKQAIYVSIIGSIFMTFLFLIDIECVIPLFSKFGNITLIPNFDRMFAYIIVMNLLGIVLYYVSICLQKIIHK